MATVLQERRIFFVLVVALLRLWFKTGVVRALVVRIPQLSEESIVKWLEYMTEAFWDIQSSREQSFQKKNARHIATANLVGHSIRWFLVINMNYIIRNHLFIMDPNGGNSWVIKYICKAITLEVQSQAYITCFL
ncbi:hypothetical protein SELMODRAFT_410324 [Selaginella moellendorffii]|uniref:Uncharacterized protein n=1 Tax=Selaginella moellendorffii TaxID=88036 RepID=D8REE1_SELML|nr:hypothetical protein SELMODRAFT_410324 [Selaginella moellendorffii]